MPLATLSIDITAKLANLERDMGRAAQIAQKNAERMKSAFTGVSTALAGLGGILSVGMFTTWVKGAIDAADRLDELSERTGATVEFLNGLDYAMKLSGGSIEEMEKGLQNLNKRLSEFAAGDKSTTALFRALGIDAKTAEEALLQLADVFPQLNKADQVRVGNELLGKSYAALVPLLAQGRAGLQGLIEEGQRLNPVTAEMAKQAAEFNDNLDRLRTLSGGAAMQLGNVLIPQINELLRVTVEANKAVDGLARTMNAQANASLGVGDGANLRERIQDIDRMIAKTDHWEKRFPGGIVGTIVGLRGTGLRDLREVLAAQERIQAQQGISAENDDRLDRMAQGRTARAVALPSLASPKKEKKAKQDDDLGEFLKDIEAALKPAEDAMARFRDIQIEAMIAGQDLTRSEQEFFQLVNSPEWAQMPEDRRELVRASFEAANATERMSSEQKRLNELLAATPTAQLEAQRQTMQLLVQAFENGRISAEQFSEAAATALGNVGEKSKETTDIMEEFSKQAARNMQDAFADFLFDPFADGLDGMLEGFGTMLRKMVAEAVAADLARRIMGPSGNGSGGWLELGMTALSAWAGFGGGGSTAPANISRGGSFTPSFDGGGWTGDGARSGGIDGKGGFPAILHPKETVIDHTKGQRAGQVINLTVNVASGAPQEVRRAAGAGAREALAAFSRAQRYS